MATTLTRKGQLTIPKQIRDALGLAPGCAVDFAVNRGGDAVVRKVGARTRRKHVGCGEERTASVAKNQPE